MMEATDDLLLLGPPPIGQQQQQRHYHSVGPGVAALHALGQIDCADIDRAPNQNPFDFFGDMPQQPQQQTLQHYSPPRGETTYINASTVAISTTGTPTIVGIGKIEPNAIINNINNNAKPKRKIIHVPTYSCNGGLDIKFNSNPKHARPSSLHNLLTPDEYEVAIQTLNEKIKTSRAKKIDYLLLGTGPLMIPLAIWGLRHGKQVKQRKRLVQEGVWEFNERMEMDGRNDVKMVWNKRSGGGDSYLTIEEVKEGTIQSGKKVD